MKSNLGCIKMFGEFVCSRSSTPWGKPCDEANKVSFVRVDRRTIDDPMKNPFIGAGWYKTGKNHRVENGMIARDFNDERWVVTIKNAEALRAFCMKHGQIILGINQDGVEPCFEIEIYDTYRE